MPCKKKMCKLLLAVVEWSAVLRIRYVYPLFTRLKPPVCFQQTPEINEENTTKQQVQNFIVLQNVMRKFGYFISKGLEIVVQQEKCDDDTRLWIVTPWLYVDSNMQAR